MFRHPTSTAAGIIGDGANVTFIFLSILYVCLVSAHVGKSVDLTSVFGQHWSEDGFCLSYKNSTYFHTHLLCFYGDLVLGALVYFVGKRMERNRPELKPIAESAGSIVAHGVTHVFLWYYDTSLSAFPIDEPIRNALSVSQLVLLSMVGLVFWYSFLGVAFPVVTPKWVVALQCGIHTALPIFVFPRLLVFGYTNTVIFCNISLIGLVQGHGGIKDSYYTTVALANIPVMAATWAEPMLCDSFLVHYGGHILFDFSIPLSTLFAAAIAFQFLEPRSHSKQQ